MSPSIQNTFFFVLALSLLYYSLTNATTSFDIDSAGCFSNITFSGDAYAVDDSLALTRVTYFPSSGTGGVRYRNPIELHHSMSGNPVSFSTYFSLLITNSSTELTEGGGVAAFVMCPDDDIIGGDPSIPSREVAIEFDTRTEGLLRDIHGNRLGVSLGATVSPNVVDLDSFEIDLRSGRRLNAWIDYCGATRQLAIRLSYGDGRPREAVLLEDVDVSGHVGKSMYVGFTALTQSSTQTHSVRNWRFNSSVADPDLEGQGQAVQQPPPSTTTTTSSNIPTRKRGPLSAILPWVIGVAVTLICTAGTVYCIRSVRCCNRCCNNSCWCCITNPRHWYHR